MRFVLATLAAASSAALGAAQSCMAAPPQAGFAPAQYEGTWYEVGKIQTFGGAIFESSCVCTQLIVTAAPGGAAGDAAVLNSCRDKTPAGAFINASAQLVNMAPPGHWDETFLPPICKVFVNCAWRRRCALCAARSPSRADFSAALSVISLCTPAPAHSADTVILAGKEGDEEYSVEYDCSGEGPLLNNYCIHILSRKPTMSAGLVAKLVNTSLGMGLNTQNLPFNFTRQEGCW
jgi:apolipoprotein D and lipocalin family protein